MIFRHVYGHATLGLSSVASPTTFNNSIRPAPKCLTWLSHMAWLGVESTHHIKVSASEPKAESLSAISVITDVVVVAAPGDDVESVSATGLVLLRPASVRARAML